MKEEIRKIIAMVEEGKISSHDASELIDAIEEAEAHEGGEKTASTSEPSSGANTEGSAEDSRASASNESKDSSTGSQTGNKDPFKAIIEGIEFLGKEAMNSKELKDILAKVRVEAKKGMESVRDAVKDMSGGSFKFFGPGERREIHLPLSLPNGKRLRIENACGKINFKGNAGVSEVVAKTEFKSTTSQPNAKERSESYTLVLEESDDEILIRQPFLENASVNLEVTVEGEISADIRTESGNITANNVGDLSAQSRSGNISIITSSGKLVLNSISGDARVSEATGSKVEIESKSGNISLEHVESDISLKSTSGNIEALSVVSQNLSLDTVSGDLLVNLTAPSEPHVSLRSVSGDVKLDLPNNVGGGVSLNSVSGNVDASLGLSDEIRTDHNVSGKIGEGSGKIEVSSVSGNIDVKMPVAQVQA